MRGTVLLSLFVAVASTSAAADTLLVEKARAGLDTGPERGLVKQQVRERFGAPESRQAPVGEPPITRWRYPDFTVYFERGRVLHTVVRR